MLITAGARLPAARLPAARRFDAVPMSPSVFVEAALAADRERVREAIIAAAARGEYGRLFRVCDANPKWAMKGWDSEPGPAR